MNDVMSIMIDRLYIVLTTTSFLDRKTAKNRRNTAPDMYFGRPEMHPPRVLKQTDEQAASTAEDTRTTELERGYPRMQPCIKEEDETPLVSANDSAMSGTAGINGGAKSRGIRPGSLRTVGDAHAGGISSHPDESSPGMSPRTRKAGV